MTKIKLCGILRPCDIELVNALKPDYIGFVFAKGSKRCISVKDAAVLKSKLEKQIQAVGVFVDESVETVAALLNNKIIDAAQLHGNEDENYITGLRKLTDKPIIKAFRMETACDSSAIEECKADMVLLDSGAGSGETFDWNKLSGIKRPYFLAGGLDAENVKAAMEKLHPYAVDVSSGIETKGMKDKEKMTAFVTAVRTRNEEG